MGLHSPQPAKPLGAPAPAMDNLRRQAAAYRDLLGLESLPQDGRQAQAAARHLGRIVLAGVGPTPLLSQLLQNELESAPSVRPRFADVSTGLRLRYLEWGPSGGSDVVLLLHDIGEAADIWRHMGARLAERGGYRVIALDLRGHGESGRSAEGRYSAESLAEDVKAFVVAKDLYVAPVAVVGCGMGAAVGLALAQSSPFLVGALLAAEFALPVAALREAEAVATPACDGALCAAVPDGCAGTGANSGAGSGHKAATSHPAIKPAAAKGQQGRGICSSLELLPWWDFRPGQASSFASVEHCAALLAHPLCNVSPSMLLPLEQAAAQAAAAAGPAAGGGTATAADVTGAAAAAEVLKELFEQLQRPPQGAIASACSLLRLPARLTGGAGGAASGYWDEEDWEESGGNRGGRGGGLQPRMDPDFLFSFDAAAMLLGMHDLRCHLLLVHGSRGSWADPADAAATATAAAAGGAASAAVAHPLPGAGHWLAADHSELLLQQIVGFLEGAALCCFDRRALHAAAAAAGHGDGSGEGGARQGTLGGRRPELLGLKPLPQYDTLDEAKKALGPRAIPSAAAVEAELRRLRLEEGRAASDDSSEDEEETKGGAREAKGQRTALAQNPPTYFGFVG